MIRYYSSAHTCNHDQRSDLDRCLSDAVQLLLRPHHTHAATGERERPDNARGVRAHTSARCRAPAGLRWGRARFVRTRVPDLETPPNDVRRQRAEDEAAQDPDTARARARPLLRPPAHVPPPHLFTHGPSMPRPRSPHPHRPAAGPRR